MCLVTSQREPKIAEEDIICYKVLIKNRDGLYSPILNVKYNIELNIAHGELEITEVRIKNTADCIYPYNIALYCIRGGVLHCYKSKHNAKEHRKWSCNSVVYKCIIPKGSKYYVSIDDIEICSDKLILLTKIH